MAVLTGPGEDIGTLFAQDGPAKVRSWQRMVEKLKTGFYMCSQEKGAALDSKVSKTVATGPPVDWDELGEQRRVAVFLSTGS